MATMLDTSPASLDVATDEIDSWSFDFSPELNGGETIASTTAVLYSTTSIPGQLVAGFVTSATVSTTSVIVAWTGALLAVGATYRLHVRATLNTGAVLVLLTTVRVVG